MLFYSRSSQLLDKNWDLKIGWCSGGARMETAYSSVTAQELKHFDGNKEVARKVLATIAAVGISPYPWSDTKKVLLWCATNAIDEMGKGCGEQEVKSANESKQQLVHALGKFASLPFTGQRFSEILLDPRRFYSSPAKLAYALEKLLRVTATVPDLSPDEYSARLAELAKEQLPPVKPLMMALDADMRVPMTMMGEGGGWGVQSHVPAHQQMNNMDVSD